MSVSRRRNIHFVGCVAALGACAIFLRTAHSRGSLRQIKGALPIRKPLTDFDRFKLTPFELANAIKLPPETVEELGTNEYLNWVLAAHSDGGDRYRGCTLSVTYYTGVVDQVPHVPEECFFQGAFTPLGDDVMQMKLPGLGETIEIRRLSFYPPRDLTERTYVYYTICVNGGFYGRRDVVRWHMTDFRDTHLYYSKVEVAIKSNSEWGVNKMDEMAREILDKTITELVRSHWPLRGWERGGPPADAGSKTSDRGQTSPEGV